MTWAGLWAIVLILVGRAATAADYWEIAAYRLGKDLKTEERNIIPLPGRYSSRELCLQALAWTPGPRDMRLRCDKIERKEQ
jgi:hypothetical protein